MNLDRIVAETFIDRVDHHAELASTNTRAAQLAAADPDDREFVLVLADVQTAGRGRGANHWWSAPGAVTCSVLLHANVLELPPARRPQLALVAGLAVCDAIESLLSELTFQLKWPNDVYLHGRKLGGILVETAGRHLILGIGINVNNSAVDAPQDLCNQLITLRDATNCEVNRLDLLIAILQRLAAGLDQFRLGRPDLRDVWTRRCLLTGRTVEIERSNHRLTGLCRGITPDGALLVETPTGLQPCHSGTVVRFE